MRRAGHRVLVDAEARGEDPGDRVDPRPVAGRGDPDGVAAEPEHAGPVGHDRPHVGRCRHLDQHPGLVGPATHDPVGCQPEGGGPGPVDRDRLDHARREVERERAVGVPPAREHPAAGVEPGRAAEHVRRRQRGVTAQVDLGGGREPPQVVVAVGTRHHERGLGQVQLGGDRLHPRLGGGLGQEETPAGLPANGASVNESTTVIGWATAATVANCVPPRPRIRAGWVGDPPTSPTTPTPPCRVADDYWETRLVASPLSASFFGDHRFDDRADDVSAEAEQAQRTAWRTLAERADAVPTGELDDTDRDTRDLLLQELDDNVLDIDLRLAELRSDQMEGVHVNLLMSIAQLRAPDPEHAAMAVTRTAAFATMLDQAAERFREGLAAGRTGAGQRRALPQHRRRLSAEVDRRRPVRRARRSRELGR